MRQHERDIGGGGWHDSLLWSCWLTKSEWARRVSNLRPLACEKRLRCGKFAQFSLQMLAIEVSGRSVETGQFGPNSAGFRPTDALMGLNSSRRRLERLRATLWASLDRRCIRSLVWLYLAELLEDPWVVGVVVDAHAVGVPS